MGFSTAPISVIIPCLNGERTLAEALESVLAQTARPLEVLVVDGGSTDRSVDVARAFGTRVRILQDPDNGPGGSTGRARSLGVTQARGACITFCDADDLIEPTKIERQLAVLDRSDPHTLVHTGSVLFWDDHSRPDFVRTGGELAVGRCTRVVFERNPVCGASVMMRKSVILELGNYNPELRGPDDFGLSLVASTCCDFVFIPEPLYRMRRHAHNMTRRRSDMAYYHWLAQERFRQRCPEAFAALPEPSVRQYMIEPVLHAVRDAYWRRDPAGYRRLLRLAVSLAPEDAQIRRLWQRRWVPMRAWRVWDRMMDVVRSARPEAA